MKTPEPGDIWQIEDSNGSFYEILLIKKTTYSQWEFEPRVPLKSIFYGTRYLNENQKPLVAISFLISGTYLGRIEKPQSISTKLRLLRIWEEIQNESK